MRWLTMARDLLRRDGLVRLDWNRRKARRRSDQRGTLELGVGLRALVSSQDCQKGQKKANSQATRKGTPMKEIEVWE